MRTIIDNELREKALHIQDATANPGVVSQEEVIKAALIFGLAQLKEAIDAHEVASQAVEADNIENQTAFDRFDEARKAGVEETIWVRKKIEANLLDLPPDELKLLDDSEINRRKNVLAALFPVQPHTLRDLRASGVRSQLTSRLEGLKKASRSDVPEALLSRLETKVKAVETTYKTLIEEGLDDAPLYEALVVTRRRLDNVTAAQRALVQSALRFENSDISLDEFILKLRQRNRATVEPAPPADPLNE